MTTNIHVFRHLCSDGSSLEIEFDMSVTPPAMTTKTDMREASPTARREYPAWANAVAEAVTAASSPEQRLAAALRALKKGKA